MPFDCSTYDVVSPVSQMLREGREQVQRGWCQRIMRQRGSVCMIGSLNIIDFEVFATTEKLMLEAIDDLGYSYSTVAAFNDDFCRTKEQVLEVYDRAIELSMPVTQRYRVYREAIAA